MISKSLKALLKHASEVIALYADSIGEDASVTITTYDGGELKLKEDEVVTISFSRYTGSFNWQFLESLTTYFMVKNVTWFICISEDDESKPIFNIELKN